MNCNFNLELSVRCMASCSKQQRLKAHPTQRSQNESFFTFRGRDRNKIVNTYIQINLRLPQGEQAEDKGPSFHPECSSLENALTILPDTPTDALHAFVKQETIYHCLLSFSERFPLVKELLLYAEAGFFLADSSTGTASVYTFLEAQCVK